MIKFIAAELKDELLSAEVEEFKSVFASYVCNRVYGHFIKYFPLDKEMSILPSDKEKIDFIKSVAAPYFGEVEIDTTVSCDS